MKINKAELITALEVVKPGIATQEKTEQSTSFAFMDERVVTYNDEISLSHPVKDLKLEGAVQAKELYAILKKMKGEEIEFEEEDNAIIFKSGRAKAGLILHKEVRMPLEEIGEIEKWKKIPDDFIHFLRFTMGSCIKDQTRPMLEGVNIRKDGWLESSDNKRITRCELGEEMPIDDFILAVGSCKEVVKFQPTKIASGNDWVHFKNKAGSVLNCRIISDKFPNVERLMSFEGLVINFPTSITEVIDRAAVFAQQDDEEKEEMELVLSKNRITVKAQNDSGWFEEKVNMKYTEDPFSFLIVPHLLQDILKEGSGCTVGADKLRFEGAGWTYVSVLKAT